MSKAYLYRVSHPDLGDVTVSAPDGPGAVKAACGEWNAAEAWAELAGYCTVEKLGVAARPKCRRCGRLFGRPGEAAGMCPECQRKARYYEREKRALFRHSRSQRKKERFA